MDRSTGRHAEARVLGQLLAAQSVLDVIPTAEGVLGFLASLIGKLPGVAHVHHGQQEAQSGPRVSTPPQEIQHLPIRTGTRAYGELWIEVDEVEAFAPYQPYLTNLATTCAVTLENRTLAAMREDSNRFLRKARDELEMCVDERTRQLRREIQVRLESEQRYRSLFEHHPDAVMSLDLTGRLLSANIATLTMTGYDLAELLQKPLALLVEPAFQEEVATRFRGALRGEVQNFDAAFRCKDGTRVEVQISQVPIRVDGQIVGIYGVAKNVTSQRQNERRVEYLATHDPLTGLPNRALLQDRLSHAIGKAHLQEHPVAVLFLDLDRFKVINDSLGHDRGDLLLKSVASRLRQVVGEGDTVARLGGDEFVVVLEHPPSLEAVSEMAGRILQSVQAPLRLGGHELVISTSIGGSLYPRDGTDPATLVRNADLAMYKAKEQSRGAFRFYNSEMNARLVERLLTENGLRRALERRELVLHYQPRIAVAGGRIVGLEALVRWQHPERGMISPQQFIPLAEEIGLIGELGGWVLREACRQNHQWQLMGLPPVKVSVNLSAQQVTAGQLVDEVRQALQETGLEARWLELELTESCLMQNTEATRETLQALRDLGVTLSIDDFGTGYSSLSYLKRLPIDVLKIDQSFVHGVIKDPNDTAIVMAMISMAHRMDLEIVAEGVTSQDQAQFLAAHQCDEMQGYLFGRPQPAEDLEQTLSEAASLAG